MFWRKKKKYSKNAAPRRWLIRLPQGPVSHQISHSGHVRGDHYFYAPRFLGAWLMILICRNMRHLSLAATEILMPELAMSFLMKDFSVGWCWLATAEIFSEVCFSIEVTVVWFFFFFLSAELLEVKKGDKKREEALCCGVIKAHERPQNETLGLCSESARAKFLKLMLLSPRLMGTGRGGM